MSRAKKAGTPEQKEEQARKLKERKERDAQLGYKYVGCPICNEAVRYRGEHIPDTCGKEECCREITKQKVDKLKGEK